MIVREIGPDDEDLLRLAEPVHRQLRPHLPADYVATMRTIFAGGARMVAVVVDDVPCGLAVWRAYPNTAQGTCFYVDDLVTDETVRSHGVGKALIAWLEERAKAMGGKILSLDSGTQRTRAHRFYFREGFSIVSFGFHKALG